MRGVLSVGKHACRPAAKGNRNPSSPSDLRELVFLVAPEGVSRVPNSVYCSSPLPDSWCTHASNASADRWPDLQPDEDIEALEALIVTTVTTGPRFVRFQAAGHGLVSVLVTPKIGVRSDSRKIAGEERAT